MKEEMNGKEFKEFVEFLRTKNVEGNEYLRGKTTMKKIEVLFKTFTYEKQAKELML